MNWFTKQEYIINISLQYLWLQSRLWLVIEAQCLLYIYSPGDRLQSIHLTRCQTVDELINSWDLDNPSVMGKSKCFQNIKCMMETGTFMSAENANVMSLSKFQLKLVASLLTYQVFCFPLRKQNVMLLNGINIKYI